MSRLLLQDLPDPHHIPIERGATVEDVDETKLRMELATILYVLTMQRYLVNLAENVPIGRVSAKSRIVTLEAILREWIADTVNESLVS